MITISKNRVCPKCGGDQFDMEDCDQKKEIPRKYEGYTVQCLNPDCNWRGFRLMLMKKEKNK